MAADRVVTAVVHLHLRGDSEEALTSLRQSLAECLAGDVRQVDVHADGTDVELPALRALHAAAGALAARGGRLRLLGANGGVRRRTAVHGLSGLLALPADPYPGDVAAAAQDASSSS